MQRLYAGSLMYVLVMGNKNYSSWSIRPWIAMKVAGIEFDEIIIPLDQPDTKSRILKHSPAGKVPALLDGSLVVWDSLAILAYLCERHPEKGLLPKDVNARAQARSACAEMHSGFSALRNEAPMNIRRAPRSIELSQAAMADVQRIEQLWADSRQANKAAGPYLFGTFSVADAMFAPVVNRLHTYKVPVAKETADYMALIMQLPAWKLLERESRDEPWTVPSDEVD